MLKLEEFFPGKETGKLPQASDKAETEIRKIHDNVEEALKKGEEYRKTSTMRYGPTHEGPCVGMHRKSYYFVKY